MPAKKKHSRPPGRLEKNGKCEKLIFRRWLRKKNIHRGRGSEKSRKCEKKTFTADQARFEKLPLNKSLRRVRKKKHSRPPRLLGIFRKCEKLIFRMCLRKKHSRLRRVGACEKKNIHGPSNSRVRKKTFTPGTGIAKMRKINFSHKTGIPVPSHAGLRPAIF